LRKKFYPKILFPGIKVAFIIGFVLLFFQASKVFFIKMSLNFDFGFFLAALFFILFSGYFVFHLSYFFSFYFKYLVIEDKNLTIFELNKFKFKKKTLEEILGYSKSEVYFGKYSWKSKSIVIYFKNGETAELVKVFLSNFDTLEEELKRKKIKYLGFEDYQTGWFYRQYKFNRNSK
jgi:hypothetical protein